MASPTRTFSPYFLGLALSIPTVVVVALVYSAYQRPLALGFIPALVVSAYLGTPPIPIASWSTTSTRASPAPRR